MSQPIRACSTASPFLSACAALLFQAVAGGAAAHALPAADVAADVRGLAQQRPWRCAQQAEADVPHTGWRASAVECAWQERLRVRSWSGPGERHKGACVSAQAQWWAWSRAASPAAPGGAVPWHAAWAAHSMVDDSGAEKRVLILRRLAAGDWSVPEWRWQPSPRAATRRWQEGRWKLLVARAAQLRATPAVAAGAPEERMLHQVLDANLAGRVAEIGQQSWQWLADGQCLGVDAAGLGQQIMQLPYAADDSRMEQRAAMQLQLARRYPKATWLTEFRLVPASLRARGGAKFYAVWMEQHVIKGQLWIPTRGNGPLVRVRITTALPTAAGPADAQVVARAEQLLTRELSALAGRWVAEHE